MLTKLPRRGRMARGVTRGLMFLAIDNTLTPGFTGVTHSFSSIGKRGIFFFLNLTFHESA